MSAATAAAAFSARIGASPAAMSDAAMAGPAAAQHANALACKNIRIVICISQCCGGENARLVARQNRVIR
jgi:hypothetical protein